MKHSHQYARVAALFFLAIGTSTAMASPLFLQEESGPEPPEEPIEVAAEEATLDEEKLLACLSNTSQQMEALKGELTSCTDGHSDSVEGSDRGLEQCQTRAGIIANELSVEREVLTQRARLDLGKLDFQREQELLRLKRTIRRIEATGGYQSRIEGMKKSALGQYENKLDRLDQEESDLKGSLDKELAHLGDLEIQAAEQNEACMIRERQRGSEIEEKTEQCELEVEERFEELIRLSEACERNYGGG